MEWPWNCKDLSECWALFDTPEELVEKGQKWRRQARQGNRLPLTLNLHLKATEMKYSHSQHSSSSSVRFRSLCFCFLLPVLFLCIIYTPLHLHRVHIIKGKRGHNRSTCCIVCVPRRRCRIWIKGAGASVHWKAGRNMRNKESPLSSSFCSLTSHKFVLCCLC